MVELNKPPTNVVSTKPDNYWLNVKELKITNELYKPFIFYNEGPRSGGPVITSTATNAPIWDENVYIKRWQKDGTLCKTIGHKWQFGLPAEQATQLVWRDPEIQHRHCLVCNKVEERLPGAWR